MKSPASPLTKEQALSYFRTQAELAAALDIRTTAISNWKEDAPIPSKHDLNLRFQIIPTIKRKPTR